MMITRGGAGVSDNELVGKINKMVEDLAIYHYHYLLDVERGELSTGIEVCVRDAMNQLDTLRALLLKQCMYPAKRK